MRVTISFAATIGTVILALAGWMLLYPERTDPKGIRYVLWKHELYRLDVPDAAAAMIGDPHRDALVLGKSKAQLEERFGHLLSLSEASPRQRNCYHEYGEEPGTEVRFIHDSDWMIIFSANNASRLVLAKPC